MAWAQRASAANTVTLCLCTQVLACLPALPWRISDAELAARRDLRAGRIFSIDPPTAKDLDDALSAERLPHGGLRVGVHIADVAHFIAPGSALDRAARERATSTYLVRALGVQAVSGFWRVLAPSSALDRAARERATLTYLVRTG